MDRKKATVARLKAMKEKREKDIEARKEIEASHETQEPKKKFEREKLNKLRVIGTGFKGA